MVNQSTRVHVRQSFDRQASMLLFLITLRR